MKTRNIVFLLAVLVMALSGCKTPKLKDADEQLGRGEYYNASQTYRKVYNKLNPRQDRELRGEVAYKLGTCYRKLNMAARRRRLPECHPL